jgi:hypothetical protein
MQFRESRGKAREHQFLTTYFLGFVRTAAFLSERPNCLRLIELKSSRFNSSNDILSVFRGVLRFGFLLLSGMERM